MKFVYKQLFKQAVKDRIFASLLFLLTVLTSLSFYFVIFSVDGNLEVLNALEELAENQELYRDALNSNRTLAYTFWLSLMGLSALVFIMFFYRFFRANLSQIGCIKALGFRNSVLQFFFVVFTAALSVPGAVLGLAGGYFLSGILMNANSQTYGVTGLIKGVGGFSLLAGLVVSVIFFCMTAALCYGFVRNKEAGLLLAGNNMQNRFSLALKMADRISRIAPAGKRLSLRIALRKPLSVLLLFAAVMSFNVFIILGQSLNISSAKVLEAQTEGRSYEYEIQYSEYQNGAVPDNAMIYIDSAAAVWAGGYKLERIATGLFYTNELYELKNQNNEMLAEPEAGVVYIGPELSEVYGVRVGDSLTADIGGAQHTFIVGEIAVNGETKHIYMNGQQLTKILGIKEGSYNGIFSKTEICGDTITSKAQRIERLNRNSVSNKTSAVINQATGILVGAILIFLALYINFQDNIHDILILNMLGQRIKSIRKLLVDVYFPILCTAFAVTFAPSVLAARAVQNSLSISTNDYMPFGVNAGVAVTAFALVSLIYWGVQMAFSLGVKKIISCNISGSSRQTKSFPL